MPTSGIPFLRSVLAPVLLLMLALLPLAPAQEDSADPAVADEATALDETMQNGEPSFYVHAEVDQKSQRYREGDTLRVTVRSEADAFVHVLYQQADGKVYQIFPNAGQPNNQVKAGQTVELPGRDDRFRWVITPPLGKEVVKVIASTEPLTDLGDKSLRSRQFNPVGRSVLRETSKDLQTRNTSNWAEVDIQIETVAAGQPDVPGSGRRWGVFVGAAQYRYNDIEAALSDRQRGSNVPGPDHNAENLAKFFTEVGGIEGHQLYTNEQATRANIEQAITHWLPQVSKPGDTVFITFSGHGGPMDDDDGDEADGMDEFITPYDFMAPDVYMHLAKNPDQIPAGESRMQELTKLVQNARDDESAFQAFMRRVAITDDTFGRWLQKLSGRQIVILLDTCHAGGFDNQEKSLTPGRREIRFDFVDGEASRLKDIGFGEHALIAGCQAEESAAALPSGEMGIMTYCLLLALEKGEGSLALEPAFEECCLNVAAVYEQINRSAEEQGFELWTEQTPHMRNYCSTPVLLRP